MGEDKGKTRLLREKLRSNNFERALKTLHISYSFVMVNNSLKAPTSSLERKTENQLRTCYDQEKVWRRQEW